MNVEEVLRSDAARVTATVGQVDTHDLLRRIANAAAAAPDGLEGAGSDDCTLSADLRLSPVAEVRHHLRHALSSPSCARRAAELFELLGYDKEAAVCWRSAADGGDRDALEYVAEFIALPTRPEAAEHDRMQMQELVEAF
ncbi:hypothetical protein GCM10020358_67470 [Amorphoplanes nipponensis]|uniref:Uncharacterized protein n=1 Tax=Actinoplanes nipponensis TaxID=135950 RepID=A0A919JIF5_9ACTN|nr:hypothetical protein [Actinoplanes nipponensis]GIE51629.1 hypothetical protein Ani05nite_51630 [Actinoplanes nipponensis]